MIQLSSLMWILAFFFAVIGFVRGWNREIVALAGIALSMFALFQFDALIRGTLLLSFSFTQTFLIQSAIFFTVVFVAYRNKSFAPTRRVHTNRFQTGLLGGIVGFFNGYLIGGTLWYFLDINEYPLAPYILAPGANSPAAHSLSSIPVVILNGGLGGSGEMLIVGMIVLFLMVLMLV